MGKNERQAYLKAIRARYRRVSKKAKARILDEFCAVCGYHRKYAIRLLNQRRRTQRRRRPGRKPIYPCVLDVSRSTPHRNCCAL